MVTQQEVMEKALAFDLSDIYIALVSTLTEVMGALLGLLETDLLKQVQKHRDVDALRDGLKRGEDDDLLCLLANAVQQAPVWKEMFESFVHSMAQSAVHEPRLSSCQGMLDGLASNEDATLVPGGIQDISLLQDQLGAAIEPFVLSAKSKLQQWLTDSIDKLALGQWKGSAQCLSDSLMEFSLLYPLEPSSATESERLAAILSKQSAEAKWSGLAGSIASLDGALQQGHVPDELLRATEAAGKLCIGLASNDEVQNSVSCTWVLLRDYVGGLVDSGSWSHNAAFALMEQWCAWVPKPEHEFLELLRVMAELTQNMCEFVAAKVDIEMIKDGDGASGKQAICSLLRKCKKAKTCRDRKLGLPAQVAKLTGLIGKAEMQLADARTELMEHHRSCVQFEIEKAAVFAKGGAEGTSWCSNVSVTAEWPDVVAAAQASLLKMKGAPFVDSRAAITKALGSKEDSPEQALP